MRKKDVYVALAAAGVCAWSAGFAAVLDPSYTIVLPDYERSGIGAELCRAADVLKAALKEGAGLEMEVVPAKKFKGGRAIYIGEAAAKRAGLVPEGMKDFSSVIAEKGGDIYLFGCDRAIHPGIGANPRHLAPVPTLKAIARFMEEYMDVRFLAPGDVGTDIPKIEKVEVPAGTFSRHDPKLEYSVAPHGTALYDYANGIFGRGRYYSYGGHTYPKACPPSKYFKDHPEYFGLVGGRRVGADEKNPTLCISNPEVQELIVNELKSKFDSGADVVQLAQQDGWQYCECEKCKAFGGPGAEYIGEKIWRLHRDIAERMLKERPGKIVHILCYSATLKPPKTFRKFPANVMIELCHVSPEQLEEWRGYEVPKGFTAYIYLWGGYQPLGYTPKRSWMRCRDFAKMMIDYGIHGVYRCGYGELHGMEGPAYWVFNHAIENPDLDVDKAVDEYCLRAFGPECAQKMRKFFETLDRRLRGVNLMEGNFDGGAMRQTDSYRDAQIQNPMELLAFVYTPDTIATMENCLAYAERHADTPKRKKRLELVRTEFEYVKNLGQIATLYAAFRISPARGTLDPLLDKIDERNRILDGICTEKGDRTRSIEGWPEMPLFRKALPRSFLATNGRLLATLGSPVGWDTKILRECGVLPGAYLKSYSVTRTDGEPSATDFGDASWSAAPWEELGGMQMEKVKAKARFKMLAGKAALYVAMESDLADDAKVDAPGRDGPIWREENCDILIAAGDQIGRRCHFILAPMDAAIYDARFGYLKDPLDPYFRKDDPRWNSTIEAKNSRGGGVWRLFVKMPYATIEADAPKPGDVWRFNVGRDTNKHIRPTKPMQLLWNPNLQSRSFTSPYAMGKIVFK